MKKSNSIKILIATLFIFTLLSIYSKNEVKATEIEMDNLPEPIPLKIVTREELDRADQRQRMNSENIIIEYDHETGETREINMEDLKPNKKAIEVLTRFYNKFYDVYEEFEWVLNILKENK